MHTTLRKIGNSRGVIIPSVFIEQLNIQDDVEILMHEGALLIKPSHSVRQGWFDGYDPKLDIEPLGDMDDLATEQEDWEW